MAFGIGFGAFAQGLSNGLMTGARLGDALQKGQSKRAMRNAIGEAQQEYDKDIADKVMTQAGQAAASAPGIGPTFDAEGAAKKLRAENPFMDFLYNKKMPELIDTVAKTDGLEAAGKLRAWADDAKERAFMKGFGKVLAAGVAGKSSGDYSAFAKQSMDLVNKGNYGMSITGYDLVKDGDGATTGITYKIKGEDGKERPHTFNSTDEAMQFIADQGSPNARFKHWMAEQEAATKLKSDIAKERVKATIGLGKDIAIEDHRQDNRLELEDRKTENNMWESTAKDDAKTTQQQKVMDFRVTALKKAGKSQQWIDDNISSILGISDTRKKMAPEDRVRAARNLLATSDLDWSRKSPEEQSNMIRALISSDDEIAAEIGGKNDSPAQPAPKRRLNVFR